MTRETNSQDFSEREPESQDSGTRQSVSRKFAVMLVRAGIWVAPHGAREWGEAILGELGCAASDWEALRWAFGGALVLAESRLEAIVFGSNEQSKDANGASGLKREGLMRKIAFATVGLCAAAMALIFVAPAGRQAIRVSMAQWQNVFFAAGQHEAISQAARLDALAERAKASHDAEGIAFVALHHPDGAQVVRLADQAVAMDPRLTWIYAVAATNDPYLPTDAWADKLRSYDPQNALPNFLTTETIDMELVGRGKQIDSTSDGGAEWTAAMEQAFESPKLDTYADRFMELDRTVMQRYGWNDPTVLRTEYGYVMPTYGAGTLPSYAVYNAAIYANSVMQQGKTQEAAGERAKAKETYAAVARFAEMFTAIHARTRMGLVQREAYERLSALSATDGETSQAALYAVNAREVDQRIEKEKQRLEWEFALEGTIARGANVVKVAGFVAALSVGVLAILAIVLIARLLMSGWAAFRVSRMAANLGAVAAAAFLASTATIYFAYRPYAEMLQGYIETGDVSKFAELHAFLGQTSTALGTSANGVMPGRLFEFWLFVVALMALAAVAVLAKRLMHRVGHGTAI